MSRLHKGLTSQIIRKMQIKTANEIQLQTHQNGYHPIKNQSCQDIKKIGTSVYCQKECKTVKSLWKTYWQFFTKLNIQFSNSTPKYTPKQTLTDIQTPTFITLSTIGKKMETGQVPDNSCMDKQNVLYTHNEILYSHKRSEVLIHKMDEL